VNHQGSRKVHESRIKTLEDELSLFSMKKDETVKEMYNRMKKITNQIKSLGGDKWGDHEIVDKLLTVYMARDVTLPSLIRAERGFKHFTAENVLGRIEAHHDQLRRVKINQDLADLQEQAEKNNRLALQAKLKGKERATQSSKDDDSSDNEDNELDDEQMALFIKNFRRVLRKSNFRNLGKNKYESRRRSSKSCFGCKRIRHFIADCPKKRRRTRTPSGLSGRKEEEQGHPRGTSQDTKHVQVKLILVKNGIQMKRATPTMKMLQLWHSRPPLCINQVCLKISPMMRIKVQSCA
jgi:hypothetical protein